MKQIIITEEQEKMLKESILLDSIPEDIMNVVFKKQTSLKDSPALPSFFDSNFIEKILKKRFEEIKKELQKIGTIDDFDDNKIETVLSKLILKCQKLEEPYRNELEKVAFNYVVKYFNIPEDSVTMNLKLVDKVDIDTSVINIDPVINEDDIEYDDLKSIETIKDEVYKRRLLNVLSLGFGMQTSADIKSYLSDIYDINPKLPELYNKILTLNNYLLFTREDIGITDKNPSQLGNVIVKLGQPEETVVIDAQAMIFPVLLCETMHGFMELFASHGLPKDRKQMELVIGKADYLKSEPWDMRLGPVLWTILSDLFENVDSELLPYLYKRIAMLSPKKFNDSMAEIFAKTKMGKALLGKLISLSKKDMEYDKFSDKMKAMQTDKNIITDEYIKEEEL